jgi:hypothetical protein
VAPQAFIGSVLVISLAALSWRRLAPPGGDHDGHAPTAVPLWLFVTIFGLTEVSEQP